MQLTKKLFAVTILSLVAISSYAQVDDNDFIVILSPTIGIPVSDIKSTNGILLGGHLSFEWSAGAKSRVVAQFGGGVLSGKTYTTSVGYDDTYPSLTLAQLRGGGKYFVAKNIYLEGLIGGARSHNSGESNIGLSYAAFVGNEFGNFDFSIRYDASKFKNYDINLVGFSLGYHF